jgi:predicted RNA-binding protein with PIN domain
MLYLIDGYNLAHALNLLPASLGPRGLEVARRSLLVRLCASRGFEADCVTVVFDAAGAPPGAAARHDHQGIRVLFSQHESADDLIEELIQQNAAPRRLTVVSDDRRIQQAARHRGCPVLGCLDYLEWIAQPRPASPPSAPSGDGTGKPDQVSGEEMKHWLEAFGAADDPPCGEGR